MMTTECRGKVPVFNDGGPVCKESGPLENKPKGDSVKCNKKSKKKGQVGESIKCPWLVHCTKSSKAETWWVRKFNDNHTCLQSRSIGKCTASFLSKEIEEAIKPDHRVPIASLKDQLQRKYELGALKNGFKAGKRDLLGLDGCFLSGPYPGQILTAVGVDPNNGIYPLAYAVVEGETKESWLWFLDCLGDDLELFRNSNFTFISDRQKGLIPALQETFPAAEHRYCLKHIYDNMKLQWRGEHRYCLKHIYRRKGQREGLVLVVDLNLCLVFVIAVVSLEDEENNLYSYFWGFIAFVQLIMSPYERDEFNMDWRFVVVVVGAVGGLRRWWVRLVVEAVCVSDGGGQAWLWG
ncbi:mutator type transposase [Tanacetum coccineum]|uniref:Mutator type transposase n=1 Tax=Tanacetum coccineum TaxID=301880 RepID=A0ABQ5DT71_9ASTR